MCSLPWLTCVSFCFFGLCILQWNCRSTANKLAWFNCTLIFNEDIFVFQDIFLKYENFSHHSRKKNYSLNRLNWPDGGLILQSWSSAWLINTNSSSDNENMGIRILLGFFIEYSKHQLPYNFCVCWYHKHLSRPSLTVSCFWWFHPTSSVIGWVCGFE